MGTVHVLEAARLHAGRARVVVSHQRQVLREPRVGVGLPRGRADGRPRSLQRAARAAPELVTAPVGARSSRPRARGVGVGPRRQRHRRRRLGARTGCPGRRPRGGRAASRSTIRNPDAVAAVAARARAACAATCCSPSAWRATRRLRRRPGTSARRRRGAAGRLDRRPARRSCGPAALRWEHDAGAASARSALPAGRLPRRPARRLGWTPRLGLERRRCVDRRLVRGATRRRGRARADPRRRSSASNAADTTERHDDADLPLLRRPARATFVDLGLSPLANAYLRAERANAMEPFYPLHASSARVPPGAARRVRVARSTSSATTPTSRRSPTSGSSTAERYVERDDRALRARTRQSQVVESPATTATCCSTSCSAACRCSASSRPPTSPQAADREGRPDARSRSSAPRPRSALARARHRGRPDRSATTCWRTCPTSTTSSAGCRSCSSPGGVDHDRVPAPAAADRREPVRHDLPRALLVLLAARPSSGVFARARPAARSTSRSCRRTAARCASTCGHADDAAESPTERAADAARARGRAAGSRRARRPTARFARAGRRGRSATCSTFLDRGASGAGKTVVGYGAPAKGNTLLNYCGVGPDLIDVTVDRSPHKQGHLLPGTHIPIRAPEAMLAGQARLRADPAVEPKDEIIEQMAVIREWGGRFVVPIPGAHACCR